MHRLSEFLCNKGSFVGRLPSRFRRYFQICTKDRLFRAHLLSLECLNTDLVSRSPLFVFQTMRRPQHYHRSILRRLKFFRENSVRWSSHLYRRWPVWTGRKMKLYFYHRAVSKIHGEESFYHFCLFRFKRKNKKKPEKTKFYKLVWVERKSWIICYILLIYNLGYNLGLNK